jgi:mono/diheme cytochrome c family protein
MNLHIAFALVLPVSVAFAAAPDTVFEQKIQPVLSANCQACHSGKTKTSGFSIANEESVIAGGNKHGRAVIAGNPASSPLIKILKGHLTPRMPFGNALPDADIAQIENWITHLQPDQSARGNDEWRWAYRKFSKPDPPKVANAAWVANPIDAFVLKKLEDSNLVPAPGASKRSLARRLYFDLVGMPPSPNEMDEFLSDSSANAYEKLVDKLLADPRYGVRWGRHWLDLVRYGETSGLEGDGAIGNAWRYRDWVVDAFNADMPYDRFVIQQIGGGDEHSKTRNNYAPDVQGHIPLAFLRLAPWDRSNLVADDVRQNYLNEITTATSSIFLGLTVGCARCHDHKYDPIPTKDFYRMQAFFQAIKVEDVDVPYKDKEFGERAAAKVKEYEALIKSGPDKKALDEFEKKLLVEFIEKKTEAAKGRELTVDDLRLELRRKDQTLFTAQEKQKQAELFEDATRTQDVDQRKELEAFEQPMLDRLKAAVKAGKVDNIARYKTLTVEDMQPEFTKATTKMFSPEDRERHRELSGRIAVMQRRMARLKTKTLSIANVPGPPNGPGLPLTHVLKSGDYRQPAEVVEPGFPSAITGNSEPAMLEMDRYRQFPTRGLRLTLAKWIASPENPLTSRVMVNRIWQYHFGRGIVETSSDFGKNGSRPTHPELVDWLASKFIEEKWSVKAMHRLILTSSTYRQSSENPVAKDNTKDPDNRLLWRFERRRLEAEQVRDGILWASGRLNLKQGGPSVYPPLPADLAIAARYGSEGGDMWEDNESESDNRRLSIYTFQRRSLPQPMMLAFDAPVFSESCERRSVTTTALQALSMMNGDLVNEEAAHVAERIATTAGSDPRTRITRAFEMLLNRPPKPDELNKFADSGYTLVSICRVLLNSNEFLYVD